MSFGRHPISPEQRRAATLERRHAPAPAPTVRPVAVGRYGGEVRPMAGQPKTKPAPARKRPRATAAEREHMGKVAALGCVVCRLLGDGPTPAQVHHCREDQGGGQRGGNFCTIPLCPDHHTGPTGIHGDKSVMRLLKVTEMDLLDLTIGDLSKGVM